MAGLSPEMAAFFRSWRDNFREMADVCAKMADACAAALGDAVVQAAPSKPHGVDVPTAAPPSRGAKRPSEAAEAAPALKCARRGTARSSRYRGVYWDKDSCKWREDAARAYNAAVIREDLVNIRPLNLEKDGVLLEKPETSPKFHCVYFDGASNQWRAAIRRSKRHGLDEKKQHLGFYEDEQDAALAVDLFARLHMPGDALNSPTLDELYESKLKVPLRVRLTYDVDRDGGKREVIAAQLTEVKYDPSHKSVEKRGVWRYRVKLEDAQFGLKATFWDPITGDNSRFAACEYLQKEPPARKKAAPTPKAASALSRST